MYNKVSKGIFFFGEYVLKFAVLTFLVNKCTIKFPRVSFFLESMSSNLEGLCTENRPET